MKDWLRTPGVGLQGYLESISGQKMQGYIFVKDELNLILKIAFRNIDMTLKKDCKWKILSTADITCSYDVARLDEIHEGEPINP